jgi:hypothetical protein
MRPADRQAVPTVAGAVARAAAICDPDRRSDGVRAFVESFEDDDRPASAGDDLSGELESTAQGIDPQRADPAVLATAAAATWIATAGEPAGDGDRVLQEGTRLFFGGEVPDGVAGWLRTRGISA